MLLLDLSFLPVVRSASPYINRFLSADTIVPGYANPQSLNRYSYVNNNPLRYTDPTGHMLDYGANEGGGGCNSIVCFPAPPGNPPNGGGGGNGGGGDSGEGDEGNCVPSPGQWVCDFDALIYEPEYCPTTYSLVDCWESDLPLYMGEDPMNIDPAEWEELLTAIRNQAHGMNRWQLIALALIYDTPFYDNSVYGFGKLPGTGCVYEQCFNRSELNYVAQGELWAAAGASIKDTMNIVGAWKLSPIMHFPTFPSDGTIVMTFVGYYDYMSHYPNTNVFSYPYEFP